MIGISEGAAQSIDADKWLESRIALAQSQWESASSPEDYAAAWRKLQNLVSQRSAAQIARMEAVQRLTRDGGGT